MWKRSQFSNSSRRPLLPRSDRFSFDDVTIAVTAGTGGRGVTSFHREKFIPVGFPDGGGGGRGGNIVVRVDSQLSTLDQFKDRRIFRAKHGGAGSRNNCHGASAPDLELRVPPGTVIRDAISGALIADLDHENVTCIIAHGGRGGRGNAKFVNSRRQAPTYSELGEPGEDRRIELELKLIADVGLIGLPNAGKSTLLAALTRAHPVIASYPFTTLRPNLGVLYGPHDERVVLADVPGIIEGAHVGVGLGIEFLRHVERTRMLIHVIDGSAGKNEALMALSTVENELRAYGHGLREKPHIIVVNKTDLMDEATVKELCDAVPGSRKIGIAAEAGTGCEHLVELIMSELPERPSGVEANTEERIYELPHSAISSEFMVSSEEGAYRVAGAEVERRVAMTDLNNEEALGRLQRWLRYRGVEQALMDAGCAEGETVRIGKQEFVFYPDHRDAVRSDAD